MVRALLVSACALFALAGCGGDDDAADSTPPTLGAIDGAADAGSSPGVTSDRPAGSSIDPSVSVDVPVVPLGTADLPVLPSGTDDLPVVPVGTADLPIVPTQTVELPTPDGGLDAMIVALTPADICALMPRDALEAILGIPLTDPVETDFDDLGAACSFLEDVGGTSATVADVELNTFDFAQQIDTESEYVEECTVAGHPAYCQEAFVDDSMSVDATVVVALGGDADPAMVVSSSAGLDAAIAIAELALSNLAL